MSRDKNAWPEPCLYCQLREEEENEEEEPSVPELRFVPAEASHLQEPRGGRDTSSRLYVSCKEL